MQTHRDDEGVEVPGLLCAWPGASESDPGADVSTCTEGAQHASDAEMLRKSAFDKLREFLHLHHSVSILKQGCSYLAATTTGNGTWIGIRNVNG